MRVIAWKAWYCGGAAFCSKEVDWAELPDDGMLGYVLAFDKLDPQGRHYTRKNTGKDWYWMSPGMKEHPIYGYSNDPKEEILTRYPGASLKRGKWTDELEMYAVLFDMDNWQP